jgi:hypothetical protein
MQKLHTLHKRPITIALVVAGLIAGTTAGAAAGNRNESGVASRG